MWLWDGKAYRLCAGRQAAGDEGAEPDGGDAVLLGAGGSGEAFAERLRDRRTLVLNAGASAFAGWSRQEIVRRLRRAGAAVQAPDQPSARRYAVALFHLLPLAVEMTGARGRALRPNRPSPEPWTEPHLVPEQDARYRPLVRLAARALYACGLDNGIVELAEDDAGKCAVAGIRLPEETDYMRGIWRDAANGLARQLLASAESARTEADPAILLGADPEFLLLSEEGKVVSAARYLEGGHGAGCDAVLVGGQVKYPIAELRPAPAATPEGLARNLRALLRRAALLIPDRPPLRWAAGGMPAAGFSLGGHLHLSGVPLTGRLLRQLDSYVAFPLAMIESPAERARRPRYGALGDFRLQPHGGFEYRTLPSWLASPLAAKGAFALALLCAKESGSLAYLPSEDEPYLAAYYAGDRQALAGCLDRLAASMAGTRSYAELARWIEPLLAAIRSGRTWDAGADIRAKWRVSR
ncbi:putative amidoligase domain-containing protein [Paenibacillus glycinis]|uniref:PhiEco32-like amidoligase-type 2 protein n=1 Tax=Paenibacillus glycinis TaxID=2697035 RepID=A0ABW9XLP5_9BACL|nr:hypothetical protein [Paenibacillus glycinis]NBD23507.1 hypothetical protein [Paenibacillus glycinis]